MTVTQSARSRPVLTLYTSPDDIQCHRTRLILAVKGVTYHRVMATSAEPSEDLLSLNPYGDMPTLVERELVLYDTTVVCEYLDERYPHPPLMQIDPLSRARLRLSSVRVELDWLPLIDTILQGGRAADKARKHLREQLLISLPLFKASKFFLNPEMSLADCLMAPVIWRLPMLGVDLGRDGKAINDYGERIFSTKEFARSLTSEEQAMRG